MWTPVTGHGSRRFIGRNRRKSQFGEGVEGGFYGEHPSLTDLDEGDLKMTTDFRSVSATMIKEWMVFDDTKSVLKAGFETLNILG